MAPNLKHNMLSNLAGAGWTAVMGLAFVPLYIALMGVEAYGLVGVFVSLQAVFTVLDLGLAQALARELARLTALEGNEQRVVDTAGTIELIYFLVAGCVFLIAYASSGYISSAWLKPDGLSALQVERALSVMALVISIRWPISLYLGGFGGLQRHVMLNIIVIIFSTLQSVGVLLVLLYWSSTVEAFFVWQAFVSFIQLLTMRFIFWRLLPARKPVFSLIIMKGVWSFAAGMTGVAVLATVLTQLDKILLSRLLSLEDFGYYVFASTVAALLFRLIGPVFVTYLPRFTQLVTEGDYKGLVSIYRQSSQIMALIIIPVSCVLAFYSLEIVRIWSGNIELAKSSSVLISMLIIGNFLNGMVNIPYALQLAHGWTGLAVCQNLVAIIILGPAIYFAVGRWGAFGAAAVWVILNFLYVTISVQVMHSRLLTKEKWRWYREVLVLPLAMALIVVSASRCAIVMPASQALTFFIIVLIGIVCALCVAAVLPVVRNLFLSYFAGLDK